MKSITPAQDRYLRKVYLTPDGANSLRSIYSLYKEVKKQGKFRLSYQQIKHWLSGVDAYTLHKPIRKKFKRNVTYVSDIDIQWQIDIAVLDQLGKYNDGFCYILTVIDVFSKYAWARAMKSKGGQETSLAFAQILKEGRKPYKLQSDKGGEFRNRSFQALLKKHNIEHFSTDSEVKAAIVERFQRTLKARLWRFFTAYSTLRYVDVLQRLVDGYNHSYHRSIKMSPSQVTHSNSPEILKNLYGNTEPSHTQFRFAVGDTVRISRQRMTFEKGYLPGWSEEIFTVAKRIPHTVPVYKLKDYDNEIITGVFYDNELQLVQSPEVYKIEKIIRKKRSPDGKTRYYVKWLGYPKKFNSWVDQVYINKATKPTA